MLALVVVGVVGGALLATYAGGSMDIPYGDDWSFSRAALTLSGDGRLQLVPWGEPTLIGHLAWAYPFQALLGDTQTALHWAVAVAAAIGLVATFLVMRRYLSAGLALFGTAVVAVLPYYGTLATTYMTDITGFAAQMACLAVGIAAIGQPRSHGRLLLALSLALGLFSYTIRDIGMVAPIAVMAGHLLYARRERRPLAPLVAVLAGTLAAAAAFWLWRQDLPGDLQHQRPGFSTLSLFRLAEAYFTVAIGALPALLLAAPGVWRRRSPLGWAAVAAALLLAAFVVAWELRHDLPFNISLVQGLFRDGEVTKAFMPTVLWAPFMVAVVAAGALLAAGLAEGATWLWRHARPLTRLDAGLAIMLAVAALYAAALIVRGLQGEQIHSRYMLGLMPTVVLVALMAATPGRTARAWRRAGVVAAVALALVAIPQIVIDKYFYGALWSAGDDVIQSDVRRDQVDAGFAWVGLYAPEVAEGTAGAGWHQPRPWYSGVFPGSSNCLTVSAAPLSGDGVHHVRSIDYTALPGIIDRRLYVYRNAAAC